LVVGGENVWAYNKFVNYDLLWVWICGFQAHLSENAIHLY
jgi:hypothetical protein